MDCGGHVSVIFVGRAVQIKRPMEFTYPVPLEAVLRAEEAVLNIKLQARRALQRASLVWTVGTDAHALLLCGCGHIDDKGSRAIQNWISSIYPMYA